MFVSLVFAMVFKLYTKYLSLCCRYHLCNNTYMHGSFWYISPTFLWCFVKSYSEIEYNYFTIYLFLCYSSSSYFHYFICILFMSCCLLVHMVNSNSFFSSMFSLSNRNCTTVFWSLSKYGSGVLCSAVDVLEMSVVRGVGGVYDMCMCLARGGVEVVGVSGW